MKRLSKSENSKYNSYKRASLTKPDKELILSKIADYQTSIFLQKQA